MAVRHGYGKVATDGLVFAYDTGDTVNSYKGEPTTNLWDSILNTQSMRTHTKHYWDGRKWTEDATYTHPGVDGPEGVHLGIVFKHVSGAFNSSWSGNSYGYMLRDIACTSGATMTQSAWIYLSSDCNLDSVPSVIEQESGGESSVAGYPSSYDLSNKGTWQITAKKAISDGQVRFIPLYPGKNGTTVGEFTGFLMWALPQVTYGDHVVQPIQPGTTRSATQGLLDLTGNTSIDLSNAGFDSNAQLDFDGTNTYIPKFTDSRFEFIDSELTYEVIVNFESNPNLYQTLIGLADTNDYTPRINFSKARSGLSMTGVLGPVYMQLNDQNGNGATVRDPDLSGADLAAGGYYHYVGVVGKPAGSSTYYVYLYRNGELVSSGDSGRTTYDTTQGVQGSIGLAIGTQFGNTTSVLDGQLPVAKVYNRALTATEVAQNFGHYKTRFGI